MKKETKRAFESEEVRECKTGFDGAFFRHGPPSRALDDLPNLFFAISGKIATVCDGRRLDAPSRPQALVLGRCPSILHEPIKNPRISL
jgi:hypothetical protein